MRALAKRPFPLLSRLGYVRAAFCWATQEKGDTPDDGIRSGDGTATAQFENKADHPDDQQCG